MSYYSISLNKEFQTHSEIRNEFSNISMPSHISDEILESLGIVTLLNLDEDITNKIRDGVQLIDGKWYKKYQ